MPCERRASRQGSRGEGQQASCKKMPVVSWRSRQLRSHADFKMQCVEDLTSSKPQANHICVYFSFSLSFSVSFSLFLFCFISQALRSSQEGGLGAGLLSKPQGRLSSRFEVSSPLAVSLGSIEGTTVSSPDATAAAFCAVDLETVWDEAMMSIVGFVAGGNGFLQSNNCANGVLTLDGACVRRFVRHCGMLFDQRSHVNGMVMHFIVS